MQVNIVIGLYYSYIPFLNSAQLEDLYQKKYKKALTYAYNNPNVKLVIYYSGPLLNWLEKNHPEYIAVLNELTNQKRVEILSGPYYEPILPLLSVSDVLGQLEKMTTSIRKVTHKRSRGCWIPGSIWDQKIISNLSNSGFSYTFLDESYFINEKIRDPYRLFQSEDQGKFLQIFPINNSLTEQLKNGEIDKIITQLKKKKTTLFTLFLAGETFEDAKQIEQIQALKKRAFESKIDITFKLPSEYAKEIDGDCDFVFLKSTTAAQYKEYFLHRFPNTNIEISPSDAMHYKNYIGESNLCNYLYGKSTYTSILINQIKGDRNRKQIAREYLWKGQNHFSYWKGETSYLSSRLSLQHFLEAEKLTREKGYFKSSISLLDLNNDGIKEYVFQGNNYNCAINSKTTSLIQMDYLPDCWNYMFSEWGTQSFQNRFLPKNYKKIAYPVSFVKKLPVSLRIYRCLEMINK